VIMKGLFGLFPDVERAKYANESSEAKLERMLEEVLKENKGMRGEPATTLSSTPA